MKGKNIKEADSNSINNTITLLKRIVIIGSIIQIFSRIIILSAFLLDKYIDSNDLRVVKIFGSFWNHSDFHYFLFLYYLTNNIYKSSH